MPSAAANGIPWIIFFYHESIALLPIRVKIETSGQAEMVAAVVDTFTTGLATQLAPDPQTSAPRSG